MSRGNNYWPENWSHPTAPGYGMVWLGKEPATFRDIMEVQEATAGHVTPDWFSLCGVYDYHWTTKWYLDNPQATRKEGGAGTHVYETQLVGKGVRFAKEPIFHHDGKGGYPKSIPGKCGEHYMKDMGEGYWDAHVGPEPGSEAEELLGNGSYAWDEERKLYVIE